MNVINSAISQNIHITTFKTPDYTEFFFSAQPLKNDTPSSALNRLAGAARERGAQMLALNVFGGLDSGANCGELLRESFGDPMFPVTWIKERSGTATRIAGIQAWGITGIQALPLIFEGKVLGVYFDAQNMRYCRLGGIIPPDTGATHGEQAAQVFQRMDTVLRMCDMHFGQVMRTWFFNHDLLDWYGAFNAARDAFFHQQKVYRDIVPASTGIEGGNPAGAALVADALAVMPRSRDVSVDMVPSPLQCAALDYGSSFSRATEIRAPGMRRLYISGTASVSPDG